MPKLSAGLLVYRQGPGGTEVLLVHPGGPLWAGKDEGAWSIPKGEVEPGDDVARRAEREFAEELGLDAPAGERVDLGEIRQAGGKHVRAWAVRGDVDVDVVTSNTFEMQWPPRSGVVRRFPEIDRAAWFTLAEARTKVHAGQRPFLDRLGQVVVDGAGGAEG